MASVRKLAEMSGLSVATVSRALNGGTGIRPATRDRVLALAKQENYHANLLVAGILKGKTRSVAFIGDTSAEITGRRMSGMLQNFLDRGYATLVLDSQNDPARESECIRKAIGFRVAGVFINPTLAFGEEKRYEEFQQRGIPVVAAMDYAPGPGVPFIHASDYELVRELLAEMVGRGHREFAYVSGPEQSVHRLQRCAGYQSLLREKGLAASAERVIPTDWSPEDAARQVRQSLAREPALTMLFCATDRIAAGALRAVSLLGLRPGTDVSVAGMGNLEISQLIIPTLTTIGHNHREWGRRAVEKLAALMEAPEADLGKPQTREEIEVEGEIFWRESTGPTLTPAGADR